MIKYFTPFLLAAAWLLSLGVITLTKQLEAYAFLLVIPVFLGTQALVCLLEGTKQPCEMDYVRQCSLLYIILIVPVVLVLTCPDSPNIPIMTPCKSVTEGREMFVIVNSFLVGIGVWVNMGYLGLLSWQYRRRILKSSEK